MTEWTKIHDPTICCCWCSVLSHVWHFVTHLLQHTGFSVIHYRTPIKTHTLDSNKKKIIENQNRLTQRKQTCDGLVTKSCPALATPWRIACQAPISMEFSRQEYWSGLRFLPQGIFLTQESNSDLWHCRQILYWQSYEGSLKTNLWLPKRRVREEGIN